MPFTFNGIGTSNYGKRDFRPDGSYITTEWFVLVFAPIFPIKSRRVLPAGKSKFYGIFYSSQYLILEKTPMNWKQVGSVYGWYAALWLSAGLALTGLWPFGILAAAICFAPWWLRQRARTRMHEQAQREQLGMGAEGGF
jgi:hypothetical protein